MGPGLGPRLGLGLESLPRLATLGRPVCSRGLRTLGPSAAVGIAAATSTAVAPGANLTWNRTADGWGFWNNAIWTPVRPDV
jgi:hypothetical protein